MANKNMKVTWLADTSKYNSGMKAAKAATKDFQQSADEALSGMSEHLGVNTDLVNKLGRALRAVAANPIIALGAAAVAGLAAGFKAINGEAEAWAKTVDGVRDNLQDTAYLNTYKQAMHDVNADIARSWDSMWDGIKQRGQTTLANLTTGFTQFVSNLKKGMNWSEAYKTAADTTKAAAENATQQAEKASVIAGQIFDVQRKQKTNLVAIANLDAEIAEYREKAADATYSTSERLEANTRAMEAIRQKFALQVPLAQKLASLMQQQVNLVSSTPEEMDAAIDAQVASINLRKEEAEALKALLRLQNSLNAARRKEFLDSVSLSAVDSTAITRGAGGLGQEGLILSVRPQFDINAWKDAQAQLQEQLDTMRAIAVDAFNTIGETVGELVGNLLTGGDAWGDFKNAALSAFGDMASSIGKIAIATGTATIAIQKSLTTLQGWGAIAAGTALVALGAAVKQGLSNVARGGSVAVGSIASAGSMSSGSMSGDFATRSINVNVTGTLKASGSSLVAVLNNEENRKQHTT